MKIKLENVRLSFPNLFEAVKDQSGNLRFEAALLVKKGSAQEKEVNKAAIAALNEKFPGKGEQVWNQIQGNNNKCCVKDGDKVSYDGYAGHIAISAYSKTRPLVIDKDKTPLVQEDGRPYAGCYVTAIIDFFGYEAQGKGISAGLKGIQFVRDGDAFGGGGAASADEFDDLSDTGDAEDFT